MAGSKFAYVRKFELPDTLLPGTFIILRIDGHSFHRFSDEHDFRKPNDERALQLMDRAAQTLMDECKDIVLSFGESDEFSFLLRKSTSFHNRRHSKLLSTLTSLFTSSYLFNWSTYFPSTPLKYPPSFDGRIVLYPSTKEVRDYFAWRQVDTHINNLYNTVFWALVQKGGESTAQAHATLRGTVSSQKHELLFSRFGINYNHVSLRYRKGSVLVREPEMVPLEGHQTPVSSEIDFQDGVDIGSTSNSHLVRSRGKNDNASEHPVASKENKKKGNKAINRVRVLHCDIISDEFWDARPDLLVE